ncbi:MAG TPA: zinc ribbon domain-containing protein [bacterium]|nr:zinc ribbon domain-containing protein [bacterium]
MDVSGTQNLTSSIQQYMSVMKQRIDSAINDAVSGANVENGNPLGDTFEFSGPADLLSKLSQLQEADPDKFKELCGDIAAKLREAASNSDADGMDAGMLESLATKFESVAKTGDLSALQPPKMPQGGGPQGAGGAPPAGASGASGGAGGVAASEECSTCAVCGAKIEDGASSCSKCGSEVNESDSEEETDSTDAAAQNAKIAQYLLYSTESEQNSLLEALTKLWEENGSNSDSGSGAMSEIREMLTQAFERITQ